MVSSSFRLATWLAPEAARTADAGAHLWRGVILGILNYQPVGTASIGEIRRFFSAAKHCKAWFVCFLCMCVFVFVCHSNIECDSSIAVPAAFSLSRESFPFFFFFLLLPFSVFFFFPSFLFSPGHMQHDTRRALCQTGQQRV